MGDENPIRTLGDYSRPSHEGYRNTIELLERNNVVPLRSDTIRLVQNGCSFHGLWSEDPNQHLKDFLKLVDSLDLESEKRERTRLRSLYYENPDNEQLLGVIECKVDILMKEAISLIGKSESVFGMTSNTMYQLPSEPSRQEEFEDLVMNIILDQEEKVRQLKNFDETKPQPQPFPSFPSLEVDLGEERDPEPPIKPPSPESFRMKEVDHLTIHTPPSPHMASFYPKDTYCYYHTCIDNPKKHYGFKPGLLGQSGSLGVDLSKLEMIEDDWELEFKEVLFLGRELNLPIKTKEL
nr:zinc finger, CCHC-type [Tanacetum cinerariifolium]